MVDDARREFGARLRSLRKRAGMTGPGLAAQVGWPKSKVSKLETGQQLPTGTDLAVWCQATDSRRIEPELRADLRNLESLVAAAKVRAGDLVFQQEQRFERERRARSVFEVDVVAVPAVLQVESYALALLESDVELVGEGSAAEALSVVRRRAELVGEGRDVRFLLGEQSLWTGVGSPVVMCEQLDHLQDLTRSDALSIGVIPRTASTPRRVTNFAIFDDSVAIAETLTSDLVTTQPVELDVFRRAWDVLSGYAVSGDEARELIAAARSEWASRN